MKTPKEWDKKLKQNIITEDMAWMALPKVMQRKL